MFGLSAKKCRDHPRKKLPPNQIRVFAESSPNPKAEFAKSRSRFGDCIRWSEITSVLQIPSKHRSKHGADWLFKAMRRDGSDVVQRDLYWDPDDEETAELVVIREGARRARKASTQAIPSSFAVDFAQLVKTAAGAKGPNQGPQGKGAGRRNSAVPAAEAPKSANGEPDSGKQSRERLGPGTKRRADDAEADVDLEGETPPVWKLNATLRDNPGAGNCLYYALGMSGVGGKEYNHRQVRRWVQQNLLYFESDFQEMWTNGGQFNCSGRTAACTWNEYLSEQMQNASWGGALEIAAFSRGAEVRTWVVDASDGTVHLINPTGAKGSIALHFDPERQHYQCYVDYVEQHLEARYTELGGKCFTHDNLLRGGGPCSTVSLRHRGVPKRQPAPVLSDCASPCPKRGAGVSTAAKGPRFLTLSECASEPAEVDQGSCAKRRRLMQSSGIAPAISDCASSEGHSYVASVMGPSSSLSERRRIVGQRSSPPALSDCSSGLACCRSACEVPRASPPALHLVPVPRVACRLGNCCGSAPEDVPVPSPAQNGRPVLSLSERRRIVGKRSRPPALSECTSGRSCCRVECEVPCASPPAPQLCLCHTLLALQVTAVTPPLRLCLCPSLLRLLLELLLLLRCLSQGGLSPTRLGPLLPICVPCPLGLCQLMRIEPLLGMCAVA